MLFALSGPEIFGLLVIKSGWSPRQYEEWLLDAVDTLILAKRD
jgi:hypothetical protein